MYDARPTTPHNPQHVMMNNFPAAVHARGSIDLPVVCSRTGAVHTFRFTDAVYCPTSQWNIFSWSQWADLILTRTKREGCLHNWRLEVSVPLIPEGRVWGNREGGLFCLRLAGAKQSAQVLDAFDVSDSESDDGGDEEKPFSSVDAGGGG